MMLVGRSMILNRICVSLDMMWVVVDRTLMLWETMCVIWVIRVRCFDDVGYGFGVDDSGQEGCVVGWGDRAAYKCLLLWKVFFHNVDRFCLWLWVGR